MSYKSILNGSIDENSSKIANALSTSYLTGGLISVNGGDPSKFDISSGTGYVINNYTDPDNPILVKVSFGPFVAQTITNLATKTTTFVGIDSSGSIVQKNTVFSNEDWRDVFSLGTLIHPDNTTISDTGSVRIFGADSLLQLSDLSLSVGNINIAGNNYSPNGSNLNLNKSAGKTFKLGANAIVSRKNPNIVTNPSLSNLTFVYIYRDGSGGITSIPSGSVDPDFYDDGSGTLAPVPNNKWTTQHVTYFTNSDVTVIEYGQTIYGSRLEAEADIVTEDFESFPEAGLGSFRLWLIVKDTTTDLEDPENLLISAGKFGAISPSGGGGGGGLTDMQGAYNNSVSPETVLDATRGAITYRDNATPISGSLFEIQSNDGLTDYLNVSATGTSLNTPLLPASGGTGTGSLTDGGILLGSGTGAVTATPQPTNGQILIGSSGSDPVLTTLTPGAGVNISTGSGSTTINVSEPVPSGVESWVPTLLFGGNAVGLQFNGSFSNVGRSIKIGRMVYVFCQFLLTNKGTSTGDATISGFPVASQGLNFPLTFRTSQISFTSGSQLGGRLLVSTITIFELDPSGSITFINETNFQNNSFFSCTASYVSNV